MYIKTVNTNTTTSCTCTVQIPGVMVSLVSAYTQQGWILRGYLFHFVTHIYHSLNETYTYIYIYINNNRHAYKTYEPLVQNMFVTCLLYI